MMRVKYTSDELLALRRLYPQGGSAACKPAMPAHSLNSITQTASRLGIQLNPSALSKVKNAGYRLRAQRRNAGNHKKPAPAVPAVTQTRRCLTCLDDFESVDRLNFCCVPCQKTNARAVE